ncbi:MAG: SMC family ATPase, partial [Lachnospiraceae bacterium]|nr:SMC family ATPase [Lachnospiraceae bacterium]
MKPIRLEMTAFGSYARLTVVDFQKLEHCLYLITGDTGAGKTTIFDGIMFALYGVASGKGEKKFRTFEMMHCDHVDKSVDTVIRLDFVHMGRDYTVERKFHFKKKRTGEKEYEGATPQATLWEPDREPLVKTDAVTARITEILGMNADQFRKIVMLAQGEFRKFLDADSEEKNQILGELFDHSAYVRFQEIFDRARKKLLQRRREEGEEKIRSAMEAFLLPEDITEEEYEIYTAGHSGLEEALVRLAEKDKKEQEQLEKQLTECRVEGNRLREALGKAEEQNKKLEELAGKREKLEELQKHKPDMTRLTNLVDKRERAFHRAM